MTQFCYLPRKLDLQYENGVHFLFDASHTSLPLYFNMKRKHGYEMLGAGFFIEQVQLAISHMINDYDYVIIPESRHSFLDIVISDFPNVMRMKKRDKLDICEMVLQTPSWRKLDKESAKKDWDKMGDTFTINTIKSNKRKDYIPHLFFPRCVPREARVLIADDFIMSGATIEALAAAAGVMNYDTLGIFYQA